MGPARVVVCKPGVSQLLHKQYVLHAQNNQATNIFRLNQRKRYHLIQLLYRAGCIPIGGISVIGAEWSALYQYLSLSCPCMEKPCSTCMCVVSWPGGGSCRIKNSKSDGRRYNGLIFKPSLGSSDSRCSCDTIQR